MSLSTSSPQHLLAAASIRFIVLTLLAALILNLLPGEGFLLWLRPDFVLLVSLYWVVNLPRRVGIGIVWILGLCMDVANGTLFGQHALAYALAAFLVLALRRRILMFPLWHQSLHIFPVLLLVQTLILIINLFSSSSSVNLVYYFLSSLTTALLWPLLPSILEMPQRRKSDPETA
ncbi:MAG: rod shape-determining protein MreD [Burkholderiales bacterium]|nr:rod shape-determining protein MreD [Sulfuricellaceae bacterium]